MKITTYNKLPQTVTLLQQSLNIAKTSARKFLNKDEGVYNKNTTRDLVISLDELTKVSKIAYSQFEAMKADFDSGIIGKKFYKDQMKPFYNLLVGNVEKIELRGLDTKKIALELKKLDFPNSPNKLVNINPEVKTAF